MSTTGAGHHDGPLHDPPRGCRLSVGEAATGSEVVVFLGTHTAGARTWLLRRHLAFERLLYEAREAM